MDEAKFKEMMEAMRGDNTKAYNRLGELREADLSDDQLCEALQTVCAAIAILQASKDILTVAKQLRDDRGNTTG